MELKAHLNATRQRRFTPSAALLLMTLTLSSLGTSLASASDNSCEDWFSKRSTVEQTHADTPAVWATLNESSQAYLTHLRYLIGERRLLNPEVLKKIADSATPINPLGERSPGVALYPHHVAFANLLKTDLQWEQIRHAVGSLLTTSDEVKKREEAAVEKTRDVVRLQEVKKFDFPVQHVVRSSSGGLLGILLDVDIQSMNGVLKINDFPLGQSHPTVQLNAPTNGSIAEVATTPTGAIAVVPALKIRQLLSVNLETGVVGPTLQLDPSELTPPPSQFASSDTPKTKSHLIQYNGQLTAVVLDGHDLYLFDPLKGTRLQKTTYPTQNFTQARLSGVVGNSIFVSYKNASTFVFDLSGQKPAIQNDKIMVTSAFSYQDKVYGLGIDLRAPSGSPLMKIVELETGREISSFAVEWRNEWPQLMEKFEQDGTLYGIISTRGDTYVVDLIKGEVKQALSKTPMGDQLKPHWSQNRGNTLGFSCNGRFYVLATRHENENDLAGELVALDALTLLPVEPGIKLPMTLGNIRMLPPDGSTVQAWVTLNDGSSRLITLTFRD